MRETNYTVPHEILKFPEHNVSVSVNIETADVPTNEEGRKILKAGTIVGGGFLADRKKKAVVSTVDIAAEGVLRYDVDVTHKKRAAAVVIHGFVDLKAIPVAPTAAQVTALKQITFLK